MLNSLRNKWRARFLRWLDRRAPPAPRHLLRRDRLYIFPTKTGFVFLLLILVLWMLGTNYQNNLILALCWLLASLFVLAILRTHGNLSGLDIQLHDADSGFAGQELAFHLDIFNASGAAKDNISLGWQDELPLTFAIDAQERKRLPVCAFAAKRGYLTPRRLRIDTDFPLGLLRCWSWLNFDARAMVYPRPEKLRELKPYTVEDEGGFAAPAAGADDFSGLRSYQPGDPLKQVAWKHYARGKGLMSKEFSSQLSPEAWLAWDIMEGLDVEQRLSALCYWALHFEQLGTAYGLDIPGTRIAPDTGSAHHARVLTALALYGQGGG